MDFIGGKVYKFELDLLLQTLNVKIRKIENQKKENISFNYKFYRIELVNVIEMEYESLENFYGFLKLTDFIIEKDKNADLYYVSFKLWENSLKVKCRKCIISFIDEEVV